MSDVNNQTDETVDEAVNAQDTGIGEEQDSAVEVHVETESKPKDDSEEHSANETAKEQTKQANSDSSKKSSGKGGSKKPKKTIKGLEMELKAQSEIIDDLSAKVKRAEEDSAMYQDKYQRLMAEFENMRKRTEKESAHMYDVGAKEVLEKLLPIVDNFERAQMAVTDEQREDAFVQGVDRIYRQILEYLAAVKVEPMNAVGKEFDPEYHNAVMQEASDEYDEGIVMEELQKGYMYKEEVLRHSMVKVSN
jgi:molecular chaperone GrpE